MSIASRINEIGVHLTKDWRSIEALTGEAEVDKNIENIATVLDNLWEEMPKVTGTGESLTLNTKKGKMKVNLLGNTSQYTTTGKNLLRPDSNLATSTMSGITFTPVYDNGELVRIDIKGTSNARAYYYLQSTMIEYGNIEGNLTLSTTGTESGIYIQHDNYINGTYQTGNIASGTVNATFNPNSLGYTQYRDYINIPYSSSTTYNTSVYPMLEKGNTATTYEPYTEGASPNPSYPQDVHIVSGDNTINVTGKNLANINVINSLDVPAFKRKVENDTITIWDNTNASGYMTTEKQLSQLCPSLKVGDIVTLTYTTTWSSNYIYLDRVYNQIWTNGSTKTITQEMLDSTVIMYGGYNATTVISNFMFRYSTADSTYEPNQSQTYPINLGEYELCKISTYQDRFIRTTGKNLVEATLEHSNLNLSGTIVSGSGEVYDLHIAKVIEGQNYTLTTQESGADIVLGFFNTKPIMSSQTYNQERVITRNTTFTAPITGYVAFRSTTGYATPMLNEGSTALPYEPYGNGEWYLEKKIGKVVLDGSENWNITSTNTASVYRMMTTAIAGQTIAPSSVSNVGLMLCNRYIAKSANDTYLKNVGISMASSGNLEIYDTNFTTSDYSLYKAWLSSNNTDVYYVLATPTYTPITGTLKDELEAVWRANSYKGTTNISQVNNDLPFIMSASALKGE